MIKCPHCKGIKTEVKDTRIIDESNIKFRKLKCETCGFVFYSEEKIINTARAHELHELVRIQRRERKKGRTQGDAIFNEDIKS